MDLMREYPDKHFELAIVDPPYGIGQDGGAKRCRIGQYATVQKKKNWDSSSPSQEYFDELFRVSNNQIIWGANHFISKINKDSSCWIFWNKLMGGDFADGELAWTSFKSVTKMFTKCNKDHGHIHPTQKPVALYKWLLQNYAQPGDKILDTHLGSGSIAIACHQMGFDLTGSELDTDYFAAMQARLQTAMAQQALYL